MVQSGAIHLNELWKPKCEKDWKQKAAKWRNRQRQVLCKAEELGEVGPSREAEATLSPASLVVGAGEGDCPSQPRRSKEHRPRGSRRRAEAVLITANTIGSSSAQELMAALRSRGRCIAALALQEHWCGPDSMPDFQAKAVKAGWKTAPVPAVLFERGKGLSAGVAVAVPQHLRLAKLLGQGWDGSPAKSPGRIAKAWVQAVTPCGLLVISIYLWPTEGLTQRNRDLVFAALGEGKAYGGPWIIMGDFNLTPEELKRHLGQVIEGSGGAVWAPEDPTFYPEGNRKPRTIDFAILDTRVMGCRLNVRVATDYSLQGHRAVEFTIKGRTCNPLCWALATPRKLPRVPKCGCARKPVLPSSHGSLETVDEQYKSVLKCIEAETCRRNDLVDEEGRPLAAFLGRGNGAVFIQCRALPPRNAGDLGEAANPALAFRWIAARAAEMAHLGRLACSGQALTVSQLKQAVNIVQKFCRRFRLEAGRKELGGKYKELDDLLDKASGFSLGDDPSFWRNL